MQPGEIMHFEGEMQIFRDSLNQTICSVDKDVCIKTVQYSRKWFYTRIQALFFFLFSLEK